MRPPTDDREGGEALLPLVDEHVRVTHASASAVWAALGRHLDNGFAPPRLYASLVGARPSRQSGYPLEAGATLPGFVVSESVARRRLTLSGEHGFARYSLQFEIVDRPDAVIELRARSRSAFLGSRGRLYRLFVVQSGAHALLVRRLLRQVVTTAEDSAGKGGRTE